MVNRGGGVIRSKWWRVGWSPGVLRWLGPRVVGTYKLLFCSERNVTSVVVISEVVGTFNHYKMVKNLTMCTKRQWGCKNFSIISSSLALVL